MSSDHVFLSTGTDAATNLRVGQMRESSAWVVDFAHFKDWELPILVVDDDH